MPTDPQNQLVTVADLEEFKKNILDSISQIVKQAAGPKKWLKTSEVRKMLGISAGKLHVIRESGLLAFTRIGGNIYYDPNDLYKLFEENKETKHEK